jgi:phage gp16-like protein
MRTLAHELCHYRQWSKDQLHDNSGDTGSDQENEANAVAGVIMRNWNQAHPEMFGQAPIERGKATTDESAVSATANNNHIPKV